MRYILFIIQSLKTDESATTDLFYSSILVATHKNSWREQISATAHNYITAVLSFNVGSSEPAMVNDPRSGGKTLMSKVLEK